MKRLLIIAAILLSLSSFAQTQSDVEICRRAEAAYRIGQFDTAVTLLTDNMSNLSSRTRSTAYHILSLCYLEKDDNEQSTHYASLLLKENPYYSPTLSDPLRFADMIEKMKSGKTATITTASQQAESIDEAPVPVTLITEEMIEASGARCLQDVIATYVPGISIVEGNQMNVSMHGVYSATQEKILVMLNGHRLNSRTTNSEALDFRNSLAKIKQIEVLRGPASSLYGNVALTAVINIITKSGVDVDGLKASYGMGDCSTYKADIVFGKRFYNTDIFAWASFYSSAGERRTINHADDDFIGIIPLDGYAMLGGFNHKPSYDFGFNFTWNKFNFMFNQQYSKKVIPYTSAALNPTIYDYYRYRDYNGIKPGNGRLSTHGEIDYSDAKGNWTIDIKAFIDSDQCNNYDVSGDTLNNYDSYLPIWNLPGEILKDSAIIQTNGVYQVLEWHDLSYGANLSIGHSYDFGQSYSGNFIFGFQFEKYKMKYNAFLIGDEYDRVDLFYSDRNRKIELGSEMNISGFLQIKQHLGKKIVLNGGFRYDHKRRYNKKNLSELSPRLALIFKLDKIWNLKASFSKAFVDAPYFYRANKTRAYLGSENLGPEYMYSWQLSAIANFSSKLNYDVNIFYNKLSDLIYNKSDERLFVNAGVLKLFGFENSISYTSSGTKANLNVSLFRVLDSDSYPTIGHKISDVPSVISNITLMKRLLNINNGHSFWLRGGLSYYSSQASPKGPIYINENTEIFNSENEISGRLLANFGAIYNYNNFKIDIQCNNIFNNHYLLGSSSLLYDIPQQGRNILVTLSYKL